MPFGQPQGAPQPGAPSPAMSGAPPMGAPPHPGPPQGAQQSPASPQQAAPPAAPKPPVTIDAVMALLRDDRMRGFRIDVETDQIVDADENAEKMRRVEFVTSIGTMLQGAMNLQESPAAAALMPAVGETIMFAVRGFKAGQQLEDIFETAFEKAAMLMAQPKVPQADPKTQAQMQTEMIKQQGVAAKTQAEVTKAQLGVEQVRQQGEIDTQQMLFSARATEMDHARQAQADQRKDAMEQMKHQREVNRMALADALAQRQTLDPTGGVL